MQTTKDQRTTTNWYVITGGPGSGKTTTINLLRQRGYKVTIEHARHYIDTLRITGRTVEEIRRNQNEFQLGVLDMQLEQEAALDPQDLVFLDRAIPDCLAYYRFLKMEPGGKLLEAMQKVSYKKVFILDILPLVNDYARTEDPTAQRKIHTLLREVYDALSIPIVAVPVMTPTERVEYVLKNL